MSGRLPKQRMFFAGRVPSLIEAMEHRALFRSWFGGDSETDTWANWKAILKAAFALPMSEEERAFFHTVAEREPPVRRVKELWIIAGRRAGKDSIASLVMGHAAAFFADVARLRLGERALCMALACDRDQAGIVLNYTRAYFRHVEPLRRMIVRETKLGFELSNDVEVAVATNSFRATRGRTILLAVLDECAFYRDEMSTNPDLELYAALKPGLATLAGSMLIGISSPYRRAGLLYNKFKAHYGRDDSDVLVIRAPSVALNPTLDQAIIDKALEEDPAAAHAEWLAEFRTDIEGFVRDEVIDGVTAAGRHELPPVSGVPYVGFVDPSGGSADSMTLAIAHRDKDGRGVLDAVREVRPPFSPDSVVEDFAALLKSYGVRAVSGDRYGGEWPRERFRRHGIEYVPSEQSESDLYRDLLPVLNSGRCELLDHPRLKAQLLGLERRTARSGRDSIDHAPGGHDDVANAASGAVLMAFGRAPMKIDRTVLAQIRAHGPYRPRPFGEPQPRRLA